MEPMLALQRTSQGEFCWIDLLASDLESQSRFYEQLFGWTHDDLSTDSGSIYRVFHMDGSRVAGARPISDDQLAAGVTTTWNTNVAVKNVDEAADSAVRMGGKVAAGPMELPDHGRMVGIEDPTGALFFLRQMTDHSSAERFLEPGSLIWNDLNTRDPVAASDFYRGLLGWELELVDASGTPYWQISVNGTVEGSIMPVPDQVPDQVSAHWLVYFAVGDARSFAARAAFLGARLCMEPVEIPGTIVFDVLSDPEGASFAIMQPLAGD